MTRIVLVAPPGHSIVVSESVEDIIDGMNTALHKTLLYDLVDRDGRHIAVNPLHVLYVANE